MHFHDCLCSTMCSNQEADFGTHFWACLELCRNFFGTWFEMFWNWFGTFSDELVRNLIGASSVLLFIYLPIGFPLNRLNLWRYRIWATLIVTISKVSEMFNSSVRPPWTTCCPSPRAQPFNIFFEIAHQPCFQKPRSEIKNASCFPTTKSVQGCDPRFE